MKFKGQMLLAVVAALFTVSMAFAFQAEEGKTAESQMKGNGGNGGAGGTGGGTTGTTTGGGTGGGTTGTTTGGGTGGSTDGGTGGGTTGGTDLGCTRTQGYWGNSPAGQRRLIELVGADGMLLGNRVYSAAELDDILDTPVRGNALISLAHQLIASKLNVLNGADDSEIAEDIVAADLLIGDLVVPPVGTDRVSSSSALGQQMLAVKDDLDDYNNGRFNVPHCR
ncbi:MAG TPA: hypothetical protein VNJ08_10990 [Bacteriovoracaceae bacterium]|nr:hypothetical protein [Bacteriovoracaceae bacterium]